MQPRMQTADCRGTLTLRLQIKHLFMEINALFWEKDD